MEPVLPLGGVVDLDLHAGDSKTPEALEKCHPVLQSDKKWSHSAAVARHSFIREK